MSQATGGQGSAATLVPADMQDHGLLLGTLVLTADGELPVEYLLPGDRVITRAGMRVLVAVESTHVTHARVVRLEPGALGAGRPEGPLVVCPGQPVMLRDWRAVAMGAAEGDFMAAGRLTDGRLVRAGVEAEARFFRLHFHEPVVIYAGGLELGCLLVEVMA